MRGSHDGSFDVSHALRDGRFWARAGKPVDTGEILRSGRRRRRHQRPGRRVLLSRAHQPERAHPDPRQPRRLRRPRQAQRVPARREAVDCQRRHRRHRVAVHRSARKRCDLMQAIGIDPPALAAEAGKAADRSVFQGLQSAYFFDKETFGADRLVVGTPRRWRTRRRGAAMTWEEFLAKTPLSAEAQQGHRAARDRQGRLHAGPVVDEKKDRLSRMSYRDFLLNVVKVHAGVIPFYQTRTHGLYGIGIDAVGALECWAFHYPGLRRHGSRSGGDRPNELHGARRRDAEAGLQLSLPGRQRLAWRACWCARSFRMRCRARRRRTASWRRSTTAQLDRAGLAGPHPPEQHGRARAARRRDRRGEGGRSRVRPRQEGLRGSRAKASCSRAGTA